MWFGGSSPKMTNRAWSRWNSFTADDRAVLEQLYKGIIPLTYVRLAKATVMR